MNPATQPNRGAIPNLTPYGDARISLAGRVAYSLLPLRQQIVRTNLRRVFGPALTDAEINRMALAFYGHLATMVWEFFTLPLRSRATRETLVRVENGDILLQALNSGRGVLVLSGHLGNFELALTCAIFPHELHGRVNILRRPFKPVWLQRLARRRFQRAGLNVIEKKRSMFVILRRLAANQAVAFPMDQHAAPKDGVLVNFFGTPAWTFRSLAVIARRTGAPVVPAAAWREHDRRHVFRFEQPLTTVVSGDFENDVRVNTQRYNDALERMISRHPEQWIWNHRRWKSG